MPDAHSEGGGGGRGEIEGGGEKEIGEERETERDKEREVLPLWSTRAENECGNCPNVSRIRVRVSVSCATL